MGVRRAIGIALAGAWCCAGLAASGSEGRAPAQLFPDARFDPRIPTQKQATGVEHGARPLRHAEILAYLRALDEASPRCRLETYARSHEGRELVYFAIGDEATVADLDAFRAAHARQVDPRGRAAADAPKALAKAVAWMAYSIHGDELSSADAAMALAYRLVAGEDDQAARLRRDLVVLIDPCENPDGRDRFLAQTAAFAHATPSADDEDLSHTTVWPWGRGNHYLFDLNRDWFTLVQPESRRSGVIAEWNPQLVVDSHEMGSDDTYLFDPARHPFNPFVPSRGMSWHERFSADQARALDARGFPYYTREWNESFFPGYGSSWAEYLGSIGILYEMSSTDGTLIKKRDGSTRTYAEAVEHQLTSSLANLTTLATHRQEILADFVTHRREVIARAGREWPAAWVLPRSRRPERTDALVRLLRAQGIEVLGPRTARVAGLRDARTGEPGPSDGFSDGAYVVPLDQPAGALVREILDPHVPMEARFLREEREYLERGRGSRLYDVTAWSLALAYDVDAYWTKAKPGAGWSQAEIPSPRGSLSPATDPVAYVIDGSAENVPTVLAELYGRAIPVRLAERPFRVDGHGWPRGSLVVRREGAPADVERQLSELAERSATNVTAVSTSRGGEGPDLGGSYFRPLVAPRIGVFTGWPVSPSDYGAVWHLLDEVVRVRFNGLDVGRFGRTDLGRYNVLVFPETLGIDYRSILGKSGVDALVRWVEGGGTAIGIGGGAEFLADVETGLTKARLRRQALATHPPPVFGLGPEAVVAGGPTRADGVRVAPPPDDEEEPEDARSTGKRRVRDREAATALREGPYDVAPVLGPGARPFAEGYAQGTPVDEIVTLAEWLAPFLPPGKREPGEQDLAWADGRLRSFSPRGAFVRIELDRDHWLGWGLPAELPALVSADDTLVGVPPVEVPARFADPAQLHLGGLLWPEAAGRLAQTAYVTRESRGRGQVILFLSPPEFRGFTLGTRRLLTNAVLYGPGLGTQWSKPW